MAKYFKNYSPIKIALTCSLVLGLINLICFLLLGYSVIFTLLYSAGLIIISFGLFFFILQVYVYDKIKIIYGSIHKIKSQSSEKIFNGNIFQSNPLEQMEREVKDWESKYHTDKEESLKKEAFQKEFLGNVAHELKTPITNIQGYVHTLIDGALYDKSVNEKFLLKASKSADRLQYLVEELLTINRFEHGTLKLNKTTFDVNSLCKDVLESLVDKGKKHNIDLQFNPDESKPILVFADKNLIHQVLTNLVVNGIKYNKTNGFVKIEVAKFAQKVIISISDYGIGIDEKNISRLFERFYRVDQSRARALGGTGLGLAIVKHILNAHEQTISVNSEINEGSTFTFSLETTK